MYKEYDKDNHVIHFISDLGFEQWFEYKNNKLFYFKDKDINNKIMECWYDNSEIERLIKVKERNGEILTCKYDHGNHISYYDKTGKKVY